MKKETLKKAKELEKKIEYLEELLGYDVNPIKTTLNSFYLSFTYEYRGTGGTVNISKDLTPIENDSRIPQKVNDTLRRMATAFSETFRAVLSEELHSLKKELEEL